MSEYPTEMNSWKHSNLLDECIGNKSKIELLILDIDGVLTDGTKVYTQQHEPVYKRFRCKDFTAIKNLCFAKFRIFHIRIQNIINSFRITFGLQQLWNNFRIRYDIKNICISNFN